MLAFVLHKGYKIQFSSYCQDVPSCFDQGNLLRRTSYGGGTNASSGEHLTGGWDWCFENNMEALNLLIRILLTAVVFKNKVFKDNYKEY